MFLHEDECPPCNRRREDAGFDEERRALPCQEPKRPWRGRLLSGLSEATDAAGDINLVTTEVVLAETVWVLESSYNLGNKQIAPLVRGILATPGLDVLNGVLLSRALDHYEILGIDFIDGYIAAVMEKQGIDELYSFDKKHVSRLKGVNRREP